tara:strand:+ start:55 stop:483 length:429 start_codon:yes stop_codon:yes gene_type:complete
MKKIYLFPSLILISISIILTLFLKNSPDKCYELINDYTFFKKVMYDNTDFCSLKKSADECFDSNCQSYCPVSQPEYEYGVKIYKRLFYEEIRELKKEAAPCYTCFKYEMRPGTFAPFFDTGEGFSLPRDFQHRKRKDLRCKN